MIESSMNTIGQFQRLFEYEKDAHARTLQSLRAAAEKHGSSPEFAQALELAMHLVAARFMWLHRFGVREKRPENWFPPVREIAELETVFDAMHAEWSSYLARLDDTELARTFEYQTSDAGRFRSAVGDILIQLFGHSWYHRGQIALLLRRMGAEPAPTDFVFWTREPA
jgi:uncharacterized damage-inducible protein DinB